MSESRTQTELPQYHHPRYLQSRAYYLSVLRTLIEGLTARNSDQQLADRLTAAGLLSPTGRKWTAHAVKHALYRLRHRKDTPNRLHRVMVELVYEGVLTVEETWVLFQPRQPHAN